MTSKPGYFTCNVSLDQKELWSADEHLGGNSICFIWIFLSRFGFKINIYDVYSNCLEFTLITRVYLSFYLFRKKNIFEL
jgi:hypothetical protein